MRTVSGSVAASLDGECEAVKGTLLFNTILRWCGGRIGKKVCWLASIHLEMDLLSIGDNTVIAPRAALITHNLEEKHFTFENIEVGRDCSIGEGAGLLGSSRMKDGSKLLPNAQGMKGIVLREGCSYARNPAEEVMDEIESLKEVVVVTP